MEPTQPAGTAAETVYRRFLTAVDDHDLEAACRCVDLGRYREDCVGFTADGWNGRRR